jgi:hypothetical protein
MPALLNMEKLQVKQSIYWPKHTYFNRVYSRNCSSFLWGNTSLYDSGSSYIRS